MSDTNEEIIQFTEAYFANQSSFDGEGMLEFWHPGGKLYLVGNQKEFRVVTIEEQVSHIKSTRERIPELKIEFVLDEIEQVVVQDELIASVHVRYRMVFPGGYGKHRCFYNMAKIEGTWGIVNAVDSGIQELSSVEE